MTPPQEKTFQAFAFVRHILIIMLGGIGDLLLMRPALMALRANFKDQRIILWIGEPGVEAILAAEALVDEVILFDRRTAQSLVKKIEFIKMMRRRHFDLAIASSGTNPLKGGLASFLMGIPYRVGENIRHGGIFYNVKVNYKFGQTHESEGSLNIVKTLGLPLIDPIEPLNVFPDDERFVDDFLQCHQEQIATDKPSVGLHPGSGFQQTFKRWPAERFAKLADQIYQSYGANIFLMGGPDEISLMDHIADTMTQPVIKAAGQLSIRQTAALIRRCYLFISNDSGLAHIAAATHTSVIVLFGQTDSIRFAPQGPSVQLIKSGDPNHTTIEAITLEQVWQVVQNEWKEKD